MENNSYQIIETADTDDWLEKRKLGIGASEAAVIMGESSWGSPLSLAMNGLSGVTD
jgi:predicted phage-related endonuclease